jgi:hypothetical protein
MLSPTQKINSLISSNTIDPKYFFLLGSPSYYIDKDRVIISILMYNRLSKEEQAKCKPQY